MTANRKSQSLLCSALAGVAGFFAVGYAAAGRWLAVVMFGSLALGLAMVAYAWITEWQDAGAGISAATFNAPISGLAPNFSTTTGSWPKARVGPLSAR